MLRGDPPVRSANTASISGSISAFAGRSGSSRAQARTCNKRTASGDNRPEPPHQTVNRGPLPLLNATPAFQAWMIVLDQPPMPIPVHALPRLFERRGGDRGQQDPFQRLLAFRCLLFPHTNDPHRQRLLARSRLLAWWQERQLPKGQLELRPALLMTMPSGKLQHMARRARKGAGLRQRRANLFLAFLHAPILGRSHQKVRLRRATRLEEREHIRPPISDRHPQASRLSRANGLHLAHPDSGFALFSLAPLIPLFSPLERECAQKVPELCTPAPRGSEGAPPAPFVRKIPVRVRYRFVPRR